MPLLTGSFSDPQELQLTLTERVASVFSLVGCLFVILTFVFSPRFRKPVNRLIFYAVWGNIIFNMATLISVSGVIAGEFSPLCQVQGFMIQAFLPADAMWNLSMAINVYLTVFKNFDSTRLKALEPYYFLVNYGLMIVIALIYCFVSTPEHGKIYGPATLWCWVTSSWDYLRILTCYGPAWLCMVASFTIYVLAGREIFQKRRQLRSFNTISKSRSTMMGPTTPDKRFSSYKTTEVHVTIELADLSTRPSRESYHPGGGDKVATKGYDQYSVTIGGGDHITVASPTSPVFPTSPTSPTFPKSPGLSPQANTTKNAAMEANTASWAYTRSAILFFASLLVTWVPSSINRVYAIAYPDAPPSFALNYISGLVLPLTGFWNSLIYMVTSRKACRALYTEDIVPLFGKGTRHTPSWNARTLHRSENYMGRPRVLSSGHGSTDKDIEFGGMESSELKETGRPV